MALVVDTGVVLATLDRKDPHHADCSRLVTDSDEELVLPAPTLVELDYWIHKVASEDHWLRFCRDLESEAYTVYSPTAAQIAQAALLQSRYKDSRIGFVDAVVFLTCVALGEAKVATLDRRHFSVLRTDDGDALTLLP